MRGTFCILVLSALIASALSGCDVAGSSSFKPAVTAQIKTALAVGCPMLNALRKSKLKLTAAETGAVETLSAVCPPHPAPTSTFGATQDLISAYFVLEPLLK